MATVYLAQDLRHDRKVAIKVLRPELAAAIGAERFLAEIRITAALQHPHILALFDSGSADSLLFYVMPFVEGESLRDRLSRERQLPISDALRITTDVCGALDYAHRQGVIHRDIKPENILLHDGHALVADFGIALALEAAGGERLTETGLAPGTPHYMSPEQSLGERSLDGRSDIYALGSVLYEMLAGEPPFPGQTAQAVIARRMTQPVPSVRVLRETVPEGIDRALAKALAKAPADRFATAREFAEAVQGTGQRTPIPAPGIPQSRRRVRLWPVVVVVLLALAALGIVRWRRGAAPALDPNLLAVVPFDVTDPALAVWGEGVVDLLSRTLDGAGSLRTVSPSVVLSHWQGRSDRASATAVARRAGAGLAATGSLTPRGADSVEVRAALLDIERAKVIGEVEVVGVTARVGELVDSLGLEILNALSRDRPVAAVRQAVIGSAPLPALKAFLRGEQFYRRGEWDSALVAYNEAITSDSSLAMAWYRMGQVLAWRPPSRLKYGAYEGAYERYLDEAHTRNHGLSDRDSLLIAADSAGAAAGPWLPEMYRLAWARLDTLARRFPGDPDAWYLLGEVLYHTDYGFGQDDAKSLDAFDRVIALDQGFSPAYEHVLELALKTGQPDRALKYARVGANLGAMDENTSSVRVLSRILLAAGGGRETGRSPQLDSAGPLSLWLAGLSLIWWPDSNETAVQVFRRLASQPLEKSQTVPWVVDSLVRAQYLASSLTFRGHLREAYQTDRRLIEEPTASRFPDVADPFLDLALLGVLPEQMAGQAFRPSLEQGVTVSWYFDFQSRSLSGLPWWAMKRDTAALALFGRRMGQAATRAEDPENRLRAEYLQTASAAYLALVRGDTVTALSRFAALPEFACRSVQCFHEKRTEAALLAARGENLRAGAILDLWFTRSTSAIAVLARLERGRIAERLNDRETAIRSYQYLGDAWRHADPELQPYVAEARNGLARLTGESR